MLVDQTQPFWVAPLLQMKSRCIIMNLRIKDSLWYGRIVTVHPKKAKVVKVMGKVMCVVFMESST